MDDNIYSGPWWSYDIDGSELLVSPVCPDCHKFIKRGIVEKNGMGQMRFRNFRCKTHGIVEPDIWWRDDG